MMSQPSLAFEKRPAADPAAAIARAWLAVACAEHVRRGRAGGFMQVCHGKAGPLRRVRPGDGVVYYSPSLTFGDRTQYRAFTAVGVVAEGDPYLVALEDGFRPWRRDVGWMESTDAPITPLLDRLDLSRGTRNWGGKLRFGLLAIGCGDFELIAAAMRPGAAIPGGAGEGGRWRLL